MHASRWIALGLILASLICGWPAAAQTDLVPQCAESLAVHLPWGNAPGECAAGDREAGGGFPGPLFEVSGGEIYLFDRVAGILSVFDRAGSLARRDSIPSLAGVSCHEMTDFRVAYGQVFFLAQRDRLPLVVVWDREGKTAAELKFVLGGELAPPEEAAEPYKLVVADDGVHLLQRLAQAAVLIHDGRPVPLERQVARPGLPVGKERVKYALQSGPISTVEGHVLASGMLRASGAGRLLVVLRRDGRERLELVDLSRGRITSSLMPSRPRGPAAISGTRYRIEADAYYEMHVEESGVKILKWLCPGL